MIRLPRLRFDVFLAVAVCMLGLNAPTANTANAAGAKSRVELPWSFKPVAKPKLPAVKDAAWPHDELDRFILAGLEAEGMQPNPTASRSMLIRRIAFDLTGLPPTAAKVAAFLDDPAPDDEALARMVDAYLASPRFGERWARHWLDIVRYADSVGRTWNPPFTYAWRYRDYVIDALNADKPYDRFLTEQIAGDLLPAKTVEERRQNLVATGLLALGAHDLQSLSHEQFVMDSIDDQIEVTTRAMLGLSVSCARCHDHKYDPITMRDYYALAGVFTSTRIQPGVSYRGQGNGYVDHEQLLLLPVATRGRSSVPAIVAGIHSMDDYNQVWRTGEHNIRYTTDPNLAMGVRDDEIADCAIRVKGDAGDYGETPPRGDLHIAGLPALARVPPQSSGRLEFAKWIIGPKQPLAARVMANRIWLHLFGQGLVETPDDFGATSEPPAMPELLDHLAVRFTADGWSIKRMIRAIVLSSTYRLDSDVRSNAADERDPQNSHYWRGPLRRMEFEALRDSLLAVSGRLSLDRPDGIQVAGIGGKSMKTSAVSLLGIDSPVRTIYLPVLRSRVNETFSTFDFPDPCQIAGRREVTTVAPQALFFMNSRFVQRSSEQTAELLLSEPPSTDADRVRSLYRRLFARLPETAEVADAVAFLGDSSDGTPLDRWALLIQALMASAEFRYVR